MGIYRMMHMAFKYFAQGIDVSNTVMGDIELREGGIRS